MVLEPGFRKREFLSRNLELAFGREPRYLLFIIPHPCTIGVGKNDESPF
jgi:hypothetical protein